MKSEGGGRGQAAALCVCVHMCEHVCICACAHICVQVCVCVHVHTCMHGFVCRYMCVPGPKRRVCQLGEGNRCEGSSHGRHTVNICRIELKC